MRRSIIAALELRSHRVTPAADGATGIRLLEGIQYDVLLTDMLLGEKDGIEVIQAARKHQPGIRIIAISGGGQYLGASYTLNMAVALGAAASLVKPFTMDELITAVEQQPLTNEGPRTNE